MSETVPLSYPIFEDKDDWYIVGKKNAAFKEENNLGKDPLLFNSDEKWSLKIFFFFLQTPYSHCNLGTHLMCNGIWVLLALDDSFGNLRMKKYLTFFSDISV